MRDPHDTLSQQRDAEAEEAVVRAKREREVNDLKWMMAHPQGRRIASRLLEQAGVMRTSFNHSGSVMAFNEGRRDIGLWFTSEMLDAAPEGYFKLLKEHQGKDE